MAITIKYDGGYDNVGTMRIERTICDACGLHVPCLIVDSSMGEYDSGRICYSCVSDMFQALTFDHDEIIDNRTDQS